MAINTFNYTTNQDPDYTDHVYQELGVHNEYVNHYQRWQFLINSYLGGHQYRLGKYLTRYVYESDAEYMQRLLSTPLDNHVKNVVHTYNSFLFRHPVKRDYGSINLNPELDSFLKDADLEGRTWEAFMREVNIMATVYGATLVLLDRPVSNAGTKAEELAQGIRTYAVHYTAPNILDWEFTRLPSGHYELSYLKLLEVQNKKYGQNTEFYVREFTNEAIRLSVYKAGRKRDKLEIVDEQANQLGKIPAVFVYAQKSPTKGIGVSDIGDIADTQQALINMATEIEQLIRLQNHPSLVSTADTDKAAGAGAIITIPNELDAGLKPYLLQPSAQSIEGILQSMQHHIQAIDRMAHLGSIRAIETRQMSGAAMVAEYTLLDNKLSEKAKNLELAEEQIWRLWAEWQGETFDGEITYPTTFHIRDKSMDVDLLLKASQTNPADARVKRAIDKKLLEVLLDQDEIADMDKGQQHPVTTPMTRPEHIREMIAEGLTDAQMLDLHPEISQEDIDAVRMQQPQQVQMMQGEIPASREIVVEGYQTKFHYMCGSAILFAQKMVREGKSGPTLRELVVKSDRVFEIEAMIEQTRTNTPEQIAEARQLVDEVKALARELNGDDALVSYMDLHIDAIVDPSLAGSLKVNA